MPTPFMHLRVAEQVLVSPQLADPIRQQLEQHWSAFYFGMAAPDFSAISSTVSRQQAHFYTTRLPGPEADDYLTLWREHPYLAQASRLPPDQAVFLAGYVSHLMLDVIWFREFFVPLFYEPEFWQSWAERHTSQNTLLVYLDGMMRKGLRKNAGITLAQATPNHWLPFATDDDLIQWRDLLVPQLAPDAPIFTVEVYAKRLKIPTEAYQANLNDPDWVNTHLFQKIPVAQVQDRIEQAVGETVDLIQTYLG